MNEILIPNRHERGTGWRLASLRKTIWKLANSCALGGLYAWALDEHWIRVERRTMHLPELGPELEGATLAQISDLHCCPIVLERYLRQCVHAVNRLNPDFVAITGDFITGGRHYARRVTRILSDLRYRIAVVACLGNHDYGIWHPRGLGSDAGMADYMVELLAQQDIFVMRNEARLFRIGGSMLQFVGLEDYWSGRYSPHEAFEMTVAAAPTVALCHNPDAAHQVAAFGPRWILSGHTHGTGTPNTRFHNLVLPTHHRHFAAGHYRMHGGGNLYVNRGLGYARRTNINARPEITLFTLSSAAPAGPPTTRH